MAVTRKIRLICYFGLAAFFLLITFIHLCNNELSKDTYSFMTSVGHFLNYEQKLHRPDFLKKPSNQNVNQNFVEESSKFKIAFKNNTQQTNSKIILMWNTWHYSMTDGALMNADCPVTSCVFTRDESLIDQSDVVVLYIPNLVDFPVHRHPHQRYVFAQLESPATLEHTKILNDRRIRHEYFNWTMTYRWDSDIVHRGEYGYLGKKKTKTNNVTGIRERYLKNWSEKTTEIVNATNLLDRPTASQKLQIKNMIKKKSKLVAWFVSHCSTPIRREEYVRQLSKFVNVDIFGNCNNRDCPSGCDGLLREHYKFYLAFENSWCQDYVTEKFYRPLMLDTVPVVLGGANYNRFAPPNSYINARDFNSPKELAEYLLMLNQSDKLYAKFFEWKRDYDVIQDDNYGLCELCKMAYDKSLPPKTYHDIKQWWVKDGGCENNSEKYF